MATVVAAAPVPVVIVFGGAGVLPLMKPSRPDPVRLGMTWVFQRRKLLRSRRTVMELGSPAGRAPAAEEDSAADVVIAIDGGGRGTLELLALIPT